MQTFTLYGIPNCDTVKKARAWLLEHGIDAAFHDFKKQGLPRELVAGWLAQLDWETLVNRKGTTWRKLPDERRAAVVDAASALELMLENPSVVKRPVLAGAGPLAVGFSPDQYARIFAKETA
jgi:arsenate reductase